MHSAIKYATTPMFKMPDNRANGCLENEDRRPKTQRRRPLENEDPLEKEDLENKRPLDNEDPLDNESSL